MIMCRGKRLEELTDEELIELFRTQEQEEIHPEVAELILKEIRRRGLDKKNQ